MLKNKGMIGLALVVLLAPTLASAAAAPAANFYASHEFVRNEGQYRADVAFVATLHANKMYVLNDGRIVHALPIELTSKDSMTAWIVLEALGRSSVAPHGAVTAQHRVTWLQTASLVPSVDEQSYSALDWSNAWPGVDMRLQITDDRTERIFSVSPGADPKQIALTYEGARFQLNGNGELIAHIGERELTLSTPVAFQDTVLGREYVDVRYVIDANGTKVAFEVGDYDHRLPLIIDPVLQSTYFGFDNQSAVTSLAVDPVTGDVIAAGFSQGVGVPGLAGGFQSVYSINVGFISRLDSKLQRVIQSTFIGGGAPTSISAVAVHPLSGEIYVAGRTNDPSFPGGGGGANPLLGGSRNDGFVARFSADLRQLLQTTFTNQSLKYVLVNDLAISASTGDVYVIGDGFLSGYLLRFNRQLTTQLSRVILEGNSFTYTSSLALNQATGDVYVAGGTTATIFPQIAGGAETSYAGEGPATFVARFNSTLSQHLQSTFLSDVDFGGQPHVYKSSPLLAVNPVSGEVYVAGFSMRTDLAAIGGAQPNFTGGQNDLVISKLSPDLRQKRGATYFGGSDYEEAGEIAFTPNGASLYLTGMTFSNNLPRTTGGAVPDAGVGGRAFIARFSASLSTLNQTTYFTSWGNISGQAVVVHPMSGDLYFGGQCLDGIVETAGGVQPYYEGIHASIFGTGCMARFDETLTGGVDTDPDAFSFVDQYAVAPGGTITSAPIRVEGTTVPVMASVTNGSFSIDGMPFDATAREVRRGESIRVRHVAAATAGVPTNTVLSIGVRSDTFTSVTASGVDTAPNAFTFTARNPVAINIDVESNAVVVAGIDAPAAISIANGEYSVDGGAFTSAVATINGGQSVVVRHRSAATAATTKDTTLTIGGVNAVFRSTTDPVDSSVHPFVFLDVENIEPNFDAISDPIRVIGINTPVPVSVAGGEWSVDGINFQSGPGVVSNFASIVLRKRSGSPGVTVSATLTVGDQSDDWVLRQPQSGDSTPDAIVFSTVTNAPPRTTVVSNDITISGVNVPIWVNITNGEFFEPVSGVYQTSGYLTNGATTRLRVFTSSFAGASEIVQGRFGTADVTFEVRNAGGDSIPDAFDFIDQTGVATGIQVISNTVTLSGLIGDTTASVSGCELSVNFASFNTTNTRVVNGSRLILRMTSSPTPGSTVTCTINIGGVVDQFRVTTSGNDSIPDPFDFVDQTDVAVSSIVTSNEVIVSGLVGGSPVTVNGCELSVNAAAFGSTLVQVVNGDRLRLRINSAGTAATATSCSVGIGGVVDQFRVTTANATSGVAGSGGASSSSGGGGGGALDFGTLIASAFLVWFRRRRVSALLFATSYSIF